MKNILTADERRLEEIAVAQTRLALEHLKLFNTPGWPAVARREEIKKEISVLRLERKILLGKVYGRN